MGKSCKGTLLERILKLGANPIEVIFNKCPFTCSESNIREQDDGVTDSLRYLLHHDNYNKPWSEQHILATLLTKAF